MARLPQHTQERLSYLHTSLFCHRLHLCRYKKYLHGLKNIRIDISPEFLSQTDILPIFCLVSLLYRPNSIHLSFTFEKSCLEIALLASHHPNKTSLIDRLAPLLLTLANLCYGLNIASNCQTRYG